MMYGLGSWPARQKIRPSWWDSEKVLSLLQAGEPVMSLCRRAAEECDGKVKAQSFRADIHDWTETASMGPQFKSALALWHNDGSGGLLLSKSWHSDFFEAMDAADGEIEKAAELAGIGVELVYARLDQRNKKFYDEEFAEHVRILEGRRISKVRENVMKQAMADTADGGKIGLKILESSMPTLHGSKQQLEITAKVEHGLAPEVVQASAARTRALLVGRVQRDALPEGRRPNQDVIDLVAEPVAVAAAIEEE